MKIDVVADGSYRRRVEVSVPAKRVTDELDKAYAQMKRRVRLKGFRQGKAPRRVLEMRFGPQVEADVATNLIQAGWSSALSDHNLDPVSRPTVQDQGELKGGDDFSFTIAVDVKPEITLESYTGLDVVFPTFEVADEEVNRQVEAKLQGQARLVEVSDRGVEKGDMVLVAFTANDGDEELVNELGTMIRTEADPYYPGLEDFLVGASVNEEKVGEVTFGDDARTEAVQGKTLTVKATVQSIQANQVPELNDEIAKELGYEGGADGLTAAIRGELESGRQELARNQARANLLQALIEKNPFEVPGGMVEQQLDLLVQELKLQQAYRGVDPRTVNFTAAQMADLRVRAEFAVKGGLILDFVSTGETLEVTDADLEAKYEEMANERGQSVEAIKGYFLKDDAVEELRSRLLEEKTLDWLLERANLVEPSDEPAPAAEAAAPAAEEAPAAEAAPAADAGEADLSILKGSIKALKEALESGDHDAHIDALIAAENDGKARAGAIAALEARK